MADQPVSRPGSRVRGPTTSRPVMAVLDLLGRRWTLRVTWELYRAPAGFRELQRRCDRMSSSVLTRRLAELTDAELVEDGPDGYRLTDLGRELVESLLPLEMWARRWEKTLRR